MKHMSFLVLLTIIVLPSVISTAQAEYGKVTLACTGNPEETASEIIETIHTLPAAGGVLYLPGGTICDLGEATVMLTGNVTLKGDGDASIIRGTGNPVLTTGQKSVGSLTLESLRIQTGTTNDGVWIDQPGHTHRTVRIFHVTIEQQGEGKTCTGTLLKVIGGSFGEISSNVFTSNTCARAGSQKWAGTTTGLWLDANTEQYTQNIDISHNLFTYLALAVRSTATWGPANAGHLFHDNNIWDVNVGMDLNAETDACDDIGILNNNFDGMWLGGIFADNCTDLRVQGNFIAVAGDVTLLAGPALRIRASRRYSGAHDVSGNRVKRWTDIPGAGGVGIEIDANGTPIFLSTLTRNFLTGNANAGIAIWLHGQVSAMQIKDNAMFGWKHSIVMNDTDENTAITGNMVMP